MKILVCVRQGLDGEINPFDASAYESALQIEDAEVIVLSMGPSKTKDFLLNLTRLGAKKAILLSDNAFAGADTLATAYTLSLAVKKICPDLIFCGRQTLVGDTAQTGPMLSVFADTSLITNVMSIDEIGSKITCTTREEGKVSANLPALLTIERINTLRLPSIMSKLGEVIVWNAEDIGADISECGLRGSKTRVIETFENKSGRRRCEFISFDNLFDIINAEYDDGIESSDSENDCSVKLEKVCIVGNSPRKFAKSISNDIIELKLTDENQLIDSIRKINPNAVLFGSDDASKRLASRVSAHLKLGVCADCTKLETDGNELIIYRPALSGSIIAKVKCLEKPAIATVRTMKNSADILVSAGYGAKDCVDKIKSFAEKIGAEMATSRKMVDNDVLPYNMQVGLTGKSVCPKIYIAIGISGAVHHIVGMQNAGTVIAINPDKNAAIFDYADYGIIGRIEDLL